MVDFVVEKPVQHYLYQVIKVNITTNKSCWHHVPLDMVHFVSVVFLQMSMMQV